MINRPLIPILFAFVGGVLAGHTLFPYGALPFVLSGIIFTLVLISLFFIPANLRFPGCLLLFFLIGFFLDLRLHRDSRIEAFAEGRTRVILEGVILEPPRILRGTSRFSLRTERLFSPEILVPMKERVLVTVYKSPVPFNPGERIRFPARLRSFRNFQNPGGYDYKSAMEHKGMACAAAVSDGRQIESLGMAPLGFPLGLAEKARRPLRDFFREHLSPAHQALYRALILGERQDMTSEMREPFIQAGVAHILAVSGLHIGLIAWLFFALLRGALSLSYRLTLRLDIRKVAALMTAVPVVLYTGLAGFQVSGQRAMVMALTYLFSMIIGREKEVWSTLALAALLVLGINPHALFTISFQLSFCAVIGILWLAPFFFRWVVPMGEKEKKKARGLSVFLLSYFGGMAVVTVAALVFLLPITVYYFHRLSLVSIPANLTIVPLLGLWVIPLGLVAALVLPMSFSAARFFLDLGTWGLGAIDRIAGFWANLPFSEIWIVTPTPFEILLYYGFLVFLFFAKGRRWAGIGLVAVSLLIAGDAGYWIYRTQCNPDVKITFLDVGQGNAALIQFPGNERMLIDGGGFSRDTFDVGEKVVAPFLLHSKIRRIDYLVLSHPQSDHMNGLRFIASHFGPREFWYNGDQVETSSFVELMGILHSKGIRKRLPMDLAGKKDISGVTVELFHPDRKGGRGLPKSSKDLNNRSLVLKMTFKGTSCLFTGDIEWEGERHLVSLDGKNLQSDILVVPHHGSNRSSSTPFLRRVHPRLSVISCGRENAFGFPHPDVLHRLEEEGSRVVRTDQFGAIVLHVGQGGMKIRTFLPARQEGASPPDTP